VGIYLFPNIEKNSAVFRALAGTAQTFIPDGTKDATRGITFLYFVYAITGQDSAGGVATLVPGGSWTLYNDGTDAVTVTCNANGSVTVARSAGADTFDVALMGVWL